MLKDCKNCTKISLIHFPQIPQILTFQYTCLFCSFSYTFFLNCLKNKFRQDFLSQYFNVTFLTYNHKYQNQKNSTDTRYLISIPYSYLTSCCNVPFNKRKSIRLCGGLSCHVSWDPFKLHPLLSLFVCLFHDIDILRVQVCYFVECPSICVRCFFHGQFQVMHVQQKYKRCDAESFLVHYIRKQMLSTGPITGNISFNYLVISLLQLFYSL